MCFVMWHSQRIDDVCQCKDKMISLNCVCAECFFKILSEKADDNTSSYFFKRQHRLRFCALVFTTTETTGTTVWLWTLCCLLTTTKTTFTSLKAGCHLTQLFVCRAEPKVAGWKERQSAKASELGYAFFAHQTVHPNYLPYYCKRLRLFFVTIHIYFFAHNVIIS